MIHRTPTNASTNSKGVVRALEVAALAGAAATQFNAARVNLSNWRSGREYTVSVESNDPAYRPVIVAVLNLFPEDKRRSISVSGHRQRDGALKALAGWSGGSNQEILIAGHVVKVEICKSSEGANLPSGLGDDGGLMSFLKPDQLRFRAKTREGSLAVIEFIDEILAEESDNKPKLWTASRWGDWRDQSDVPARRLDTVVLRKGLAEDIHNDLSRFLAQEEEYSKFGLPWHRGYLLHGCPGSGKTSLVKALASELNLDLYAISLPGIRDDQTLINLMSSVEPRSALLLEDIDTAGVARERKKDGDKAAEGITMSGLLNTLDGVGTPHGLIVFMTSNHKDRLDPALLRPGRCDRTIMIDYVDTEQLNRMVETFSGKKTDFTKVTANKITPAAVIELYKEHLGNPDDFIDAVEKMVKDA